ncbi:putative copper-transporting ATPase [Micromonospora humidisoli]|uniref:heavy metal translocating P-type ATPase n=1 Tax=Micromonospora sp. AKA109 TaxID=2733865 RepID=UPI0022BBE37F|nr:heavy metal translocating P-type ATPase [Micromonospora sp. AKA109]GHJ10465.1 putative copper-transporting ATPase [Micromonospora sp. AKA109]
MDQHRDRAATPHPGPTARGGHTDPVGPAPHRSRVGHAGRTPDRSGGEHVGHDPATFRRRFLVCLALTLPVVATDRMVLDWVGHPLEFPGRPLVGPVLGSVVFWWGGWPFLTGALREARARTPGMMLLVAMAISVAYTASVSTFLGAFDLDFWWELAALVTIMLLGHWQETKAIGQARGALDALAALLPDDAERVGADDDVERVPVTGLREGDVVLVRPGGRVPADGRVVAGTAELDESMVTGESRPVPRSAGDRVVAGTVATDQPVRVRVEAVGEATTLAGIRRLVTQAQRSGGRAQALADRFAGWLFYVATGTAVLTALVWTALGEPDQAVVRAVTVLVIACPHALGLAIPLVVALSTGLAARSGVLVRDRLALERMRTVDAVLFDKTGTLTRGEHVLVGVAAADGTDGNEVLRLAAAVEADSEHPLARAIVAAAADRGGPLPATGFRALPGRGVRAVIDGTDYAVGGPALLRELGRELPGELTAAQREWTGRAAVVLYLVRLPDTVVGLLALADQVRPEAREAVDALRAEGVRTIAMLTGDARPVAEAVAADLGFRPGVDEVFAEVLPADKDRQVAGLQRRGLRVAVVGDGVNDAPALARADVGIAIGAGADVAVESAGVVLASSDPRGVAGVLRLSRAAYRTMLQNLAWAAGYNVVALPLAAGVLAGVGITLGPAVGAVLMSASTIVVALNAQLLRRVRLDAR